MVDFSAPFDYATRNALTIEGARKAWDNIRRTFGDVNWHFCHVGRWYADGVGSDGQRVGFVSGWWGADDHRFFEWIRLMAGDFDLLDFRPVMDSGYLAGMDTLKSFGAVRKGFEFEGRRGTMFKFPEHLHVREFSDYLDRVWGPDGSTGPAT